jgi:oxygen-independent coproporphyrinogen-3 oxidase
MTKVGIYIQVPFCQTKCTYCNFHTGVVSPGRFAPYSSAVCQEILNRNQFWGAARVSIPPIPTIIDTVYIGGGTPSLLKPELLADMLTTLRESFRCEFREVTLEADPETIEADQSAKWAATGINRISMGSQSFVDEELKAVGRMHRRADIYRAVPILRQAGIHNISFDLIAGLPKQTTATWRQSLEESIALSPGHISIYMMEIDQGSRLGLEVLQGGARYSASDLPAEESIADFYQTAQQLLKQSGYEQYEISNWAKPGWASGHNLKYWRREPYFGFGAGAHSFSGGQRWANVADAAAYVAAVSHGRTPIQSVDKITPDLALEEEFFLGLRQLSGINLSRIEREYGVDFQQKVGNLTSNGWIEQSGAVVRLPVDKLSVSNEIIVELLR